MDNLSLFEKIIVIGVGGFIVLVVVLSFITDFIENWHHWLIWFGAIGVAVGVGLLFF